MILSLTPLRVEDLRRHRLANWIMAYDDLKEFEGETYTGVAIGGEHTWLYPNGLWRAKKGRAAPWVVTMPPIKKAGTRAPPRSGGPGGTRESPELPARPRGPEDDAHQYHDHTSRADLQR